MKTIRHYDDPAAYPAIKNGEVTEYPADDIIDDYNYLGMSACPTECTGLITHGPVNDAALNSYQDVYPFLVPPVTEDDPEKDS